MYLVAEGALQTSVAEELRANGFEVQASADPAAVADEVVHWRPDVVLVQESLSTRAGRQVVLSLRARGEAFSIPLVGLLTDLSVPTVLHWLRVGATDLWRVPFTRELVSRTTALIEECQSSQVQLGTMRVRLTAFARRARLSGTVVAWSGTPFEASATFVDGELQEGRTGSMSGAGVLDVLMQLDGPVLWQEGAGTQPMAAAVAPSTFRARVLLVEDDAVLRKLLGRQLESAGYEVETAADGQLGLQAAVARPYDVLIADLDLPRLDGWGLLREVRNDVQLRELSVLVLSAHEQAVDTLKAARAGARAYLKKSGRARELLDTMALLVNPRARVVDALKARRNVEVEVRSVGAAWVLRQLAELDCQGLLELEDELGRYSFAVAQGQLVSARATRGSSLWHGADAISALLVSRGAGRFTFEKRDVPAGAPWVFEVVDRVLRAMKELEERQFRLAVTQPGHLYLNSGLVPLFAQRATLPELKVLDEVGLNPPDLQTLVQRLDLPTEEVTQVIGELLRRGVLTTSP